MALYFYNALYFSHKYTSPHLDGQLLYMGQVGADKALIPPFGRDDSPGVGEIGRHCELRRTRTFIKP